MSFNPLCPLTLHVQLSNNQSVEYINVFVVVGVKALIIVDSGGKKAVLLQVPLNAPESPCIGKFFHGRTRPHRTCREGL